MWVIKWKEPGCKVPEKLVDAFELCDAITFPNIHVLLQLIFFFPGSSGNYTL